VGLDSDGYRAQDVVPSGWTGMADVEVPPAMIDTLFKEGVADPTEFEIDTARDLPCHTGLRLLAGTASALGRVTPEQKVRLVRGDRPGSENERMQPWAQAVFDTLGALVSQDVLDEVMDRGMLEVLPLTHIRGRSLHDSFVIVDEAQSLERNVLLTVLSRLGTGSRVVLTHDVAQRDNLRVGRHDGVAAVIEALKGHPMFAHV